MKEAALRGGETSDFVIDAHPARIRLGYDILPGGFCGVLSAP